MVIPSLASATPTAPDQALSGTASSFSTTNNAVHALITENGVLFAGGEFTAVTPPGGSSTTRSYLASFTTSTGQPTSFAPTLNGTVNGLALSADDSTLYVAGAFTTANGSTRNHFAAFNTSTGALTSWNPNAGGGVGYSVATFGTSVYLGGTFTTVGGTSHARLAAVSTATGALLAAFAATADNEVNSMALPADGSRLIVVGNFNTIAGVADHGDVSLDPTTGALEPWAANGTLPNTATCTSDGAVVTISGSTAYVGGDGVQPGCYDGDFAANVSDGALLWNSPCEGATAALTVLNGVLYKGSHMHDCSYSPGGQYGGFTGALSRSNFSFYRLIAQNPSNGSFVHWSPSTNGADDTHVGPLAMTNDGTRLFLGGDFTTVNGSARGGLAVFSPTTASTAPVADSTAPVATPSGNGRITVTFPADTDIDNGNLSYTIYRGTTAITTVQAESWPWAQPTIRFTDTGLTPGTAYTYHYRVSDGTSTTASSSNSASVTALSGVPDYQTGVLAASPSLDWRLDDSGSIAADASGHGATGQFEGGVTTGSAGAVGTDPAVALDGTSGFVNSANPVSSSTAFTESAWFKTSSETGGTLLGDSTTAAGSSGTADDGVWLDNDGQVAFDMASPMVMGGPTGPPPPSPLRSANTYNDGLWHQVTATYDGTTQSLYVDGSLVGSQALTASNPFQGYLLAGYGNLTSFMHVFGTNSTSVTAPNSYYFQGSLDEVASYSSALSAGQVASQWEDNAAVGSGGGGGVSAPVSPNTPAVTSSSATTADVSWSGVAGATTYQVLRAVTGTGTFAVVDANETGTSFHDSGLLSGTSYDYEIEATNSGGTSAPSGIGTILLVPGQPGTLTAHGSSTSEIDLTWGAAAGATSYDVRKGTVGSGTFSTDLGTTGGTSLADTGLAAGVSFDYQVIPSNSSGAGAPSNTATGSTQSATAPGQVTGLQATAASSTEVDLSWTAVAGATSYEVDRSSTSATSGFAPLSTTVSGAAYSDTTAAASTQYWYVVTASNGVGPGPASATVTATTPSGTTTNPAVLSNSFEGGTSGAALTAANSGGTSGNKFDAVSCSGGTSAYSSAAAHGSVGALLTPSTSACYLQWGKTSITAPATTSYGRLYVKLGANPAATMVLAKLGDSSFVRDVQLDVSTTGKLTLFDAANTKQKTFTTSLPLGSWVRIEWTLVNASSGSFTVSAYQGDSTTPIETESETGVNTGTVFGSAQIGEAVATTTPVGAFGLDSIAYGTVGPLGPSS